MRFSVNFEPLQLGGDDILGPDARAKAATVAEVR